MIGRELGSIREDGYIMRGGNIFMMVVSRWWAYVVGMVVVVQSGEI